MPVLSADNYKPLLPFRYGHINTMYPYFFRKKIDPGYQRQRHHTKDGDFLDLDWLKNGNKRLAILCHGLEGSSRSQYMTNTAHLLSNNDIDVCCMNYRSCSGEMNLKLYSYHSGYTADLHEILETYGQNYDKIYLVGYSLGGNMVMKYSAAGNYQISPKINAVVAVSAPCDLSASSAQLMKKKNKPYVKNFLDTLLVKARKKQEQFPDAIDWTTLDLVKDLYLYDEYVTAPTNGFADAEDYYDKSNSLKHLHKVHIPTLLINAQDDSFLSESSIPYDIAKENKNLYLKAPKFGGHLGFTTFGARNYWNETEILNFINTAR